ncbi:MAG: nuclear transport factor 2 family protein [Pseudolabrys sp.]|nr:nuclear transport factor 2 family protein [Pseudolabrys sp.]MCW5683731.1 nuclear transport factor 2 family protein [Pseudolabrys sp.]
MSTRDPASANATVLQELTALEVDYWYDVDHNWGRTVSDLYVPDGVFSIGDKVMAGQEAIAGFYRWREGRGDREARHVVTNFRVDARNGNRATFRCIMLLYAADGKPVLESRPAIMIADIIAECEYGQDSNWRFISHRLIPIFMGGEAPTIPQDK